MTAQIATTTPPRGSLVEMLRFANVVTDVADTLGRMGVDVTGLNIDRFNVTHGAAFGVGVQVAPLFDPATVDRVASTVPAAWWTDDDGETGNYTRVGLVRFGGELVRMRVFTGRPDETTGGAR